MPAAVSGGAICYGFVPIPGVRHFDSNNNGLAPGVKTKEQYKTDTPVLVLMGEICIHCANQACENKQRFNSESTDTEED